APSRPGPGTARGSRRPAPGTARRIRPGSAARPAATAPETTRAVARPDRARTRDWFRSWPELLDTTWKGRQDLLEPVQSPDVPLTGRRLLEMQLAGDLGVGQFLEMPQHQDLAIQRVHGVEGLLQPHLPLGADRRHAGAGVAAQELSRQGRRGRLGP